MNLSVYAYVADVRTRTFSEFSEKRSEVAYEATIVL